MNHLQKIIAKKNDSKKQKNFIQNGHVANWQHYYKERNDSHMDDNWQDNPKLAGIDKNKLDMLQQMARQGAGKSPSDLLPFIMNAASQGRNAGLNFNSNEINTIIEVLKMGKSPRERAKLDKVVNLMKMIK